MSVSFKANNLTDCSLLISLIWVKKPWFQESPLEAKVSTNSRLQTPGWSEQNAAAVECRRLQENKKKNKKRGKQTTNYKTPYTDKEGSPVYLHIFHKFKKKNKNMQSWYKI